MDRVACVRAPPQRQHIRGAREVPPALEIFTIRPYYFTRNEPKNYQKRIAHIVTKLGIRPYYGYFEKAARNKEITPQIIEKHGIALALQWVLSWREESKVKQEAIKDKNNISEADRAVQDGMTNLSMSLGERRFFRPLP
jgi:hypothetical protein